MVKCKICNDTSAQFHKELILNKYNVAYYKCNNCEFIQTENPYWLTEAYSEAIATTDIGLVGRNLLFGDITEHLLKRIFPDFKSMLDYGGGYGLFVRLMRDKGFDFYRQDNFCRNIFAQYFNINDKENSNFDFLTAFEVFEHLAEPLKEIETMLSYSTTILFSTQLAPASMEDFRKWWYLAPNSGQHVCFYSYKSLEYIAKHFNKKLYSNKVNLHLLTHKGINAKDAFRALNYDSNNRMNRFNALFEKNSKISFTEKDHEYVLKRILKG